MKVRASGTIGRREVVEIRMGPRAGGYSGEAGKVLFLGLDGDGKVVRCIIIC